MTGISQTFEALPIPRQGLTSAGVHSYRVYKDMKDFVVVQAHTALEAFKTSGLPSAHKIERNTLDFNRVLDPAAWPQPAADDAVQETSAAAAAVAEEAGAPAAPAQA